MWMPTSIGSKRRWKLSSRSVSRIILLSRSRRIANVAPNRRGDGEGMKAKRGVLDILNKVLVSELTAVHQYLVHAALCKHWGYGRLHEHFSHLAQEEVSHSSGLIDHILYLGGAPGDGPLGCCSRGQEGDGVA